ncbi:hypothetical protein [Cysteiniphilum halobium]|uniref:hypothetical protein n=1 Tax=Cysteiniphilum halobium TaxID=2219059 RepID=UPI003F835B96
MKLNLVTQDELGDFENKITDHFEALKNHLSMSMSTLLDIEIDTKEAIKQLGCSRKSITNHIEKGNLRSVSNSSSKHRFKFADVIALKQKAS